MGQSSHLSYTLSSGLGVELILRDLTEWAKHGVLLLNTSLTVRAHEVSHLLSYLLYIHNVHLQPIVRYIRM
jgi:uracil DNA glycosylase